MSESKSISVIKQKKKLYITFKIILTTLFAITILFDNMLVFTQNLRASAQEIYFSNLTIKNIVVFIMTWIITFGAITLIEFVVSKVEDAIYTNEKEKKKRVFWIIFGIIMLLWMPYILTYFPGGIFSDTQVSIKQCLHLQPYDNKNPLAYTLLIKLCLGVGDLFNSSQIGIDVFGICQITVMVAILSYFVYWLYKKDFSNTVLVLITLFFGFFKLIPMYALSIWKDTPFCLAVFLYILNLAEIVYQDGKNLNDKKEIAIYILLFMAVAFLRNNGLYVGIATTLIILLVYRKNKIFKFTMASIIAIVLTVTIQGPVFRKIGLTDPQGGFNAIMVNQIFYVKVTDGNITEEQNEIIDKMCEPNKLKEKYAPLLLDATTINPEFNNGYIVQNYSEVKRVWKELFIQNPYAYVKAFLLNTLGFWDVNRAFPDAYVSNYMWKDTESIIDVHQTDWIEQWSGQSVKEKIQITKLYSSAIFLFIMLTSMIFAIKNKNYKNLLIYLPALFTWGTIVLATPIAFSLRYVYILVLMIPLDFVIPFLQKNNNEKGN